MKLYGFSGTETDIVIKEHVGMPAEKIVCKVPIVQPGDRDSEVQARLSAADIMGALTLVSVIRELVGTL